MPATSPAVGGPTIVKHHVQPAANPIKLETFQATDFNVLALVEQLMDDDVRNAKQAGGGESHGRESPFDPKPHIATLEQALSQLLPLRKANANKIVELERSVAAAERAYRSDVRGAKAGFESVNSQFQALDAKISGVGRTAARIGEQLESIDRQRQRASEAHDLILYYNEFAAGDTSRLERMRKEGGREGRAKVALAARRLLSLAKEVEGVDGADRTRATIEKYCEQFEKDMLRLFDRYYRKGDPKAMAVRDDSVCASRKALKSLSTIQHCAQTLQDFNGGQSCIQIYVNQHDFFISKERVQEAASGLVSGAIWESLPDPDAPAPKSEPGLANLYEEIRITVGQEAQIVTAVFPNPAVVMQVFLQRVFAQVIQAYIETLIQTASSSSSLAYLRILHVARSSTTALVEDLKGHEFFRNASAFASSSTSITSPVGATFTSSISDPNAPAVQTGGASTAAGGVTAVSTMLDQVIEELFVPYMEGTRYLDRESKSLTELYAGKLLRFTNWHRAKNQEKSSNTIFDRVVNQVSSAVHQGHKDGGQSSAANDHHHDPSRLDRLLKLSGLSNIARDKHGDEFRPELMFEEGDGELDLEVAEKMLKWHAEAVGRMVELSSPGDVPKQAFSLLKTLADSFGKGYLETALDTALHQLSVNDGKTEPDLGPLRVIKNADIIMHLWQRYIATALVPLAGTSVTIRREMGIFNNHVSVRIEGKVNVIAQKTTDAVLSWISILLSKQKKTDFKPRNDNEAFSKINTEPCISVCDFLVKVREAATEGLSGKNLEVFLTEVGVTFHTLLLDHFKKFPISATGGLMLTKDLALYQDTISTFSLASLDSRFEMLRQLGNVFIVQPKILKSYLTEQYLGRIENRLLRPFIMMRTDYGDYGRKFWDDVLDESTPAVAAGSGATSSSSSNGNGLGRDGFPTTQARPIRFSSTGTNTVAEQHGGSTTSDKKSSVWGGLMNEFKELGLHDRPLSMSGRGSTRADGSSTPTLS
ncbi:Exocyst complex component 5 [Microbotryomycetes sp. JL201]|nr:Exocyst complex component 5 [Microbotryomycetes sp. JL201]